MEVLGGTARGSLLPKAMVWIALTSRSLPVPLPEVSGAVQAKPGASGSDARTTPVSSATK